MSRLLIFSAATDLIEFNGTVVSRGAQSAYSLVGGLRHTFSHATWSELALGIGSGKHFDFKSHLGVSPCV